MKNIISLAILFLTLSCSKSNEEKKVVVNNNPFYGTWVLSKVLAGFAPGLDYTNEEVKWIINSETNILVQVVEGTLVPPFMPLNENGTYPYSINPGTILLEDVTYDYSVTIDTLIVSKDAASDGIIYIFEKIIN